MIIDKINKALPRSIHIDEYLSLYPYLVPVSKRKFDQNFNNDLIFKLKLRSFEVKLEEPSQVQAVFVVDPADKWEEKCQVKNHSYNKILCDLATTTDGNIGSKLQVADT